MHRSSDLMSRSLCRLPDGTVFTLERSSGSAQTGVQRGSSERAEQYRRRACLMMASTIQSEESRASLIAMAQTWLRLAEEPLSVPPEVSDRPQPAVQQQQQKQPEDERGDE